MRNCWNEKKSGEELDKEPRIEIINKFIEKEIEYFEKKVEDYDKNIKPETEKLDRLFRETLNEVWK